MNDDIKTQLCKDDFYFMLENALIQAGGGIDIDKLKKMSLVDVVNILAQNGIRMVYMPEKHMNSVKIVWEASIKSNSTYKIPDLPPKKKQLLCDQFGDPLAEEEGKPTGYGGFY